MRSHTPRDFAGTCARCFLKTEWCLCAELPKIQTNTQIIIVRHVTEEWLTSNTARLATLMLSNARILPYGGGEPFDARSLYGEGTLLLTPDAKPNVPSTPPRRLVLLDGTFRQARRMFKKIPELRDIEQCSLLSSFKRIPGLRRPPRSDGLSTIEAIAQALAQFEQYELAAPLLTSYAEFVRRSNLARGRQRQPRQANYMPTS
jgi:DTW domain-containing protein